MTTAPILSGLGPLPNFVWEDPTRSSGIELLSRCCALLRTHKDVATSNTAGRPQFHCFRPPTTFGSFYAHNQSYSTRNVQEY